MEIEKKILEEIHDVHRYNKMPEIILMHPKTFREFYKQSIRPLGFQDITDEEINKLRGMRYRGIKIFRSKDIEKGDVKII